MAKATIKDRLYLVLFNIFQWIVRHTPESVKKGVIFLLARLAYLIDRRRRHIAQVNLDLAYGDEMPQEEKTRIIKKSYENLLYMLSHFVENQGISREKLLSKVTFENEEILLEAIKSGRPILSFTAHYGNWEILSLAVAAKFRLPLTIIGRPLDSYVMNQILERNRQQFDIVLHNRKNAMRKLLAALKRGRAVGLLVDQNLSARYGILVDFFGKKALHTPSISILARGTNAIVIPIFIRSEDQQHFHIKFYPPLEVEKSENKEEDIRRHVQAQADLTEQVIREKPDEWFWFHQRWKNQYEELYKVKQ